METKLLSLFTTFCLLFVVVLATSPKVNASVSSDYCVEPVEIEFLTLINNYRSQNGLGKLTLSWPLSAAAQHHSIDMAKTHSFTHTLSDGTTWYQNIVNHGYPYSGRGENIAWGYTSATSVFNAWKNSPSHNANMLYSTFNVMGIDVTIDPLVGNGWFWTNTFAVIDDNNPPPLCVSTQPTSAGTPTVGPTSVMVTPTSVPTPIPTMPVSTDTTPPTVSLTNPIDGAIVVRRSSVTLSALASDDVAVTKVDFMIDNKLKCSDYTQPYSCIWKTPNRNNASYTISARSHDSSGNSTMSTPVTIIAE